MIRPYEHFIHGNVVVIPAEYAYKLNRLVLNDIRPKVRGADPQLDQVLQALGYAGLRWAESARGPNVVPQREPVRPSTQTVSTTTAATVLGITGRAVRRAITDGRLPATAVEGRWRIDRAELETYRANRAA